jgi:hypothetical protein
MGEVSGGLVVVLGCCFWLVAPARIELASNV